MQMYMEWNRDNGSTSSSQTLIIPRLPRFENMVLSQFNLYIETQKMTQCIVCRDCKNNILIRAPEGKEKVFSILHMLRIYTSLQKWSKINVFELHLEKTNSFDTRKPCVKIEGSELLFEQYIMALNQ